LPESGFQVVRIEESRPGVEIYTNDFNLETDDFEGNGFIIEQPIGFANDAIHSEHPYPTAVANRTLNFIYELLKKLIWSLMK